MGDDLGGIDHRSAPNDDHEPLGATPSPLFHAGGCEIYLRWQRPTVWREHRHRGLQIVVSGDDAETDSRWRFADGRRGHAKHQGSHVWLVPGGVWHGADWHRPANVVAIHVGADVESRLLATRLLQPSIAPIGHYTAVRPVIGELCATLWEECRLTGPTDRFTVGGMAQALVGHILRTHQAPPHRGDPQHWILMRTQISSIRDYVENHLDGDLSLQSLAVIAGLSPSYFGQVFRAAVGLPPAAYVAGARVRRARDLLRIGNHTATDVAHIVGFSSLQLMTVTFRRLLGTVPSDYLPRSERNRGEIMSSRKRIRWRFC
jgi:AraC-like DNA-binding protein